MGNLTGVSNTNDVLAGNTYVCYRSYPEATLATIKKTKDSPQEFFGGTYNPEFPGRALRTGFPIYTGFSCMTSVMGSIRQLDRL